jgi:hypothetical protein
LKATSFPVPNGENGDASVVSCEQQHAAFQTGNDIDFEVDNGSNAESEGDVNDVVDPDEDDSSEEDEAPARPTIDIELLARHLPKAGTQSVTRKVARA